MAKYTKQLTLIKLGGSIITNKDKPYTAKPEVIRRLAKELKKSKNPLILAHGSGSFGHTSATKYGGKKGYKSKVGIAKVARDAMEINRIVMDILVEEGLPAVSFRPMSMISAKAGQIEDSFFKSIELALSQELIPVVYGDVIWDKKWKSTILSGETILNSIGIYMKNKGFKIDRIIQAGETNGVYDNKKTTIPVITNKTWSSFKEFVVGLKVKDVTGGMKHKVKDALKMADSGIKTLIINGTIENELLNALSGKKVEGTLIK
jgi:isopentenyl phosphate kinase